MEATSQDPAAADPVTLVLACLAKVRRRPRRAKPCGPSTGFADGNLK